MSGMSAFSIAKLTYSGIYSVAHSVVKTKVAAGLISKAAANKEWARMVAREITKIGGTIPKTVSKFL